MVSHYPHYPHHCMYAKSHARCRDLCKGRLEHSCQNALAKKSDQLTSICLNSFVNSQNKIALIPLKLRAELFHEIRLPANTVTAADADVSLPQCLSAGSWRLMLDTGAQGWSLQAKAEPGG